MSFECIPDEMKRLQQWVCVRNGSKVPFMSEICSMAASSTASSTWSSFEAAVAAVKEGWYDGIGFVFSNNGLIGIDIDSGFDEDGVSDLAMDIISTCSSYTERSRSGRGFHIIVKGDMPLSGINNHAGLEIYKNRRYFIMTGNVVMYDRIYDRQEAVDYILNTYCKGERVSSGQGKVSGKYYMPQWKVSGKLPARPVYPEIGEGSRNMSLLSLGGSLVSQGYSGEQILDEMRRVNQTRCVPPLNESELRQIYRSVMRYKRE